MNIIANPSARSGAGKQRWQFWHRQLLQLNVPFTWNESASAEDCTHRAEQSAGTVVAVGGDGTINNVLNGVMRAARPKAMGVLYAGTSPDFCRFHRIPTGEREALEMLLAQNTRPVDVGRVAFAGGAAVCGKPMERFFSCSCNIGLGAAIARFANTWRCMWGDTLGTGLGVVLAMLRHRPFSSGLVLDGQGYTFEQTNHIIVLKNPYLASSLRLNLDVRPDDGLMYVIVIHQYSRLGLLGIIRSFYKGDLLGKKNVFVRPCVHAEIVSTPAQEVEFDGDPQGFTPVRATLLPQALSLICGRIS